MLRKIKILSDRVINVIAAGEVVEKPASVVKELVENALDAGASEITVKIERGGKNLIEVTDNGIGIDKEDLPIALERHATSKLDEEDINNIQNFGFRGEALPSIGAVCKLKIISRTENADCAWEINIDGGEKSEVIPASHEKGTTIEVRDLFSFTPSRLKFLKSDLSERTAIVDLIHRFALGNQKVAFKLISDGKIIFKVDNNEDSEKLRIAAIIGEEFIKNSLALEAKALGVKLAGFVSKPTFNHATNYHQYFFVNKRFLKDKLLFSALKTAYSNLIPQNRYASVVLFIEIDPYEIDVNVHPAKTEIRFREAGKIRDFIVKSIRKVLEVIPTSEMNTNNDAVIKIFNNEVAKAYNLNDVAAHLKGGNYYSSINAPINERTNPPEFKQSKLFQPTFNQPSPNNFLRKAPVTSSQEEQIGNYPLGFAKFQILNTYIIAANENDIILVDQHAAHERLVLERIKRFKDFGNLPSQALLIPEIVALGVPLTEKILEYKEDLKKLGFDFDRNGLSEILIRKVPDVIGLVSLADVFKELSEYIMEHDSLNIINERIEEIFGNIACHSSIRAGRKLNAVEMNALLREIERTPLAGQCNHGRPTYVILKEDDLNKIFQRG